MAVRQAEATEELKRELERQCKRQRRRDGGTAVQWWALGLGLALALGFVAVASIVAHGNVWWWSWDHEWWWVWVVAAIVTTVFAAAGVAAAVALVGAAVVLTLAKRLLSWWLYVLTAHVLSPLVHGLRHVPGLERAVNNLIRVTILVWVYGTPSCSAHRHLSLTHHSNHLRVPSAGLVLFERNLRWFLKHFVGHHKETGRPYSLVNCLDTRFDGAFCVWPTDSAMQHQVADQVLGTSLRGVC